MVKTRIIILVLIVGSVILIYNRPRVVVDNKEEKVSLSEPVVDQEEHMSDNRSLPDSLVRRINSLKELISGSDSKEKSLIFADSLAETYKEALFYDSAAYFLSETIQLDESAERLIKVGDAYFEAFNFAMSEAKRANLAQKAQEFYNKVLEADPSNLDVKANLAMTYVSGPAPMKGINLLREVIEEDPKNEKALLNLGLLSITSGQMDKAIERFESLLEYHPESHEARLYLGYCLLETGKTDLARIEFEKILKSNAPQDIKDAASGYLESIS